MIYLITIVIRDNAITYSNTFLWQNDDKKHHCIKISSYSRWDNEHKQKLPTPLIGIRQLFLPIAGREKSQTLSI